MRLPHCLLMVALVGATSTFAQPAQPAPPAAAMPAVAPAPPATSTPPAAPDFAALDKPALVLLCQQYHRMNALLEKRVAELEATRPAEPASDLEALRDELAAIKTQLSAWMTQIDQRLADTLVVVDESTLGNAILPTPAYRYEYELNLIGERGTTRILRRDLDGTISLDRVHFSDFRSDLIELRVFFRNDSNRRARFNMLIGLGENRLGLGLPGNRPRLVGRDSYTTPYLVPGEVHPFTLRIPVDNAYAVDFAEIGKVQAFE